MYSELHTNESPSCNTSIRHRCLTTTARTPSVTTMFGKKTGGFCRESARRKDRRDRTTHAPTTSGGRAGAGRARLPQEENEGGGLGAPTAITHPSRLIEICFPRTDSERVLRHRHGFSNVENCGGNPQTIDPGHWFFSARSLLFYPWSAFQSRQANPTATGTAGSAQGKPPQTYPNIDT